MDDPTRLAITDIDRQLRKEIDACSKRLTTLIHEHQVANNLALSNLSDRVDKLDELADDHSANAMDISALDFAADKIRDRITKLEEVTPCPEEHTADADDETAAPGEACETSTSD